LAATRKPESIAIEPVAARESDLGRAQFSASAETAFLVNRGNSARLESPIALCNNQAILTEAQFALDDARVAVGQTSPFICGTRAGTE
jgi:hypothetical protein